MDYKVIIILKTLLKHAAALSRISTNLVIFKIVRIFPCQTTSSAFSAWDLSEVANLTGKNP